MLGGFLTLIYILGWLAKTIICRSDWESCKHIIYLTKLKYKCILLSQHYLKQGNVCQKVFWSGDCGINQLMLKLLTITHFTKILNYEYTTTTLWELYKGECK